MTKNNDFDSEFDPWLRKFGKHLKKLRIDHDINQDDFEDFSEYTIAKRQYQRYEAGHTAPTLRALYKISKTMGVSVKELIPE